MTALYESLSRSGLGPIWSALAVGFAVIGFDGHLYLTGAGERYLVELDA